MADVYKITADVSSYEKALDRLVGAHSKLLQAEGTHAKALSNIERAETGATHAIEGTTKSGLKFTSTFEAANGVLTQTAAALDLIKQKGGQSVSKSFAQNLVAGLDPKKTTTPQVVKIDKALVELEKLVTANKVSKKELESIWQNLNLGLGGKLEGELGRVQSVLRAIKNATKTKLTPVAQPAKLAPSLTSIKDYKDLDAQRQSAAAILHADLEAKESVHLKKLKDLKKQATQDLKTLGKQRLAQTKAVDTTQGVRASKAAIKKIEENAAADSVKIATKRLAAERKTNTAIEALRQKHATQVAALDQKLTGQLAKAHAERVSTFRKSIGEETKLGRKELAKRLKDFRAEKAAELKIAKATAKAATEIHKAERQATLGRARANRGAEDAATTALPIGKNAKPQGILNYNKAKDDLLKYLETARKGNAEQRAAVKQLNKVWADVAKGKIRTYGAELDKLQRLIHGVRDAHSQANVAAGYSRNAQIRESHAISGALDAQREQLVGLTLSWQTMFRMIVSQATSRALSAFISQIQEAKQEALDLSVEFARIQTLDNTNTPIDGWVEGIRKLNETSGIDILEQTGAAYEALSNQIGEGTEALQFMKHVNDLAIVSGASAVQSQELLADAIHAWGLEVANAGDIAATFFKIVDLGRATVAEMAPNLGRLAVPAAQLGVSLEEVGAALATTTLKGVKMETASTLLRNVMLKLAKPSEALKGTMRDLGFDTGEAWIATKGFGGVLADLEKVTRGSSTELANQLKNIRAITGATVFAGDGLRSYYSNLEQISTATDTYSDNVKKVTDSVGILYDKASAKISNLFVFDTVGPLLKNLSDATDGFDDFVTVAEKAKVVLAGLAGAAIPVLILGIGKLITATGGLAAQLVFNSNPWVAAAVVIASVAGTIYSTYLATTKNMSERNKEHFTAWLEHYDKVQEKAAKTYTKIQKGQDKAFKKGLVPVRNWLAETAKSYNKLGDISARSLKEFNSDVKVLVRDALDGASGIVDAHKANITRFKSELKGLENYVKAAYLRIENLQTDQSLVGKTDIQSILILSKELKKLAGLRDAAVISGDYKEFEKLAGRIDTLAGKRQALQLKVTASPKTLLDSVTKTLQDLNIQSSIFSTAGDEVGVARIKKEYKEIQAIVSQTKFVTPEQELEESLKKLEGVQSVALLTGDDTGLKKLEARIAILQSGDPIPRVSPELEKAISKLEDVRAMSIAMEDPTVLDKHLAKIESLRGETVGPVFYVDTAVDKQFAQVTSQLEYMNTLKEQGFTGTEPEIKRLKELQSNLSTVFKQGQSSNIYSDVQSGLAENVAAAEKLKAVKQKQLSDEEKSLAEQVRIIKEFKDNMSLLLSFKQEDFNTTDKITKSLEKQLGYYQKMVALIPSSSGALSGVAGQLTTNAANFEKKEVFGQKRSDIEAGILKAEGQQQAAQAAYKTATANAKEYLVQLGQFASLLRVEASLGGTTTQPVYGDRNTGFEGKGVDPKTFSSFTNSIAEFSTVSAAANKAALNPTPENLTAFVAVAEQLDLVATKLTATQTLGERILGTPPTELAGPTQGNEVVQLLNALINKTNLQGAQTANTGVVQAQKTLEDLNRQRADLAVEFPELPSVIENTAETVKSTSAIVELKDNIVQLRDAIVKGTYKPDLTPVNRLVPEVKSVVTPQALRTFMGEQGTTSNTINYPSSPVLEPTSSPVLSKNIVLGLNRIESVLLDNVQNQRVLPRSLGASNSDVSNKYETNITNNFDIQNTEGNKQLARMLEPVITNIQKRNAAMGRAA